MRIGDTWYRTIWPAEDGTAVEIIDQTLLPHVFEIRRLRSVEDAAEAIRTMRVRGAPLIGATAAYGLALALRQDGSDDSLEASREMLAATRPTAINLQWALDELAREVAPLPAGERAAAAWACAARICDDDVEICRRIGEIRIAGAARDRPTEGSRTRQHSDPLQCRLARHRRLGDRAGPDLHGARLRDGGPRVGRRDPTAQSGCRPDRLRAGLARCAPHSDRGQRGRPSHATRNGRSVLWWAPIGPPPQAMSPTRSGLISRRSRLETTKFPFSSASRRPPWTGPCVTASPKFLSRNALRRNSPGCPAGLPRARSFRSKSPHRGVLRATGLSMSHRRGW